MRPAILVTGGAGWLGSRLLESLRGDGGVRALVLPAEAARARARHPDVDWIQGDLRDAEALSRFCAGADGAVLYHCAGVIHPRRVRTFYEVHVEGTRALLDAASRSGVKRVVALSSNSPFGCNPHPDHLFDEEAPYHPYRHYGRSKMLLEREVARVQQEGRLETVIIRAPWFYGPDQPPRQTTFFRMIRAGRAPVVGGGENLRSMAYLDNLCDGLRLAAASPAAAGRAYWIADERPYSWNEILDTVARLLERDFKLRVKPGRLRLPDLAAEVAGAADAALQAVGLYNEKLHVLSESNKTIACSIARARRELGYAPKIALEEGMRRSIASLVNKGVRLDC